MLRRNHQDPFWRGGGGLSVLLALVLAVAVFAVPSSLVAVAAASSDDSEGDESESVPGPCDEGWVVPTPVSVAVDAVPIVVASTTADYFVLYVTLSRWSGSGTYEIPVSVTRGGDGTTTLSDNLPPLAADNYRVEKYQVAQPADVDGDCVDDITELDDLGAYNPTNRAPKMDVSDGMVAIASHEDFEALRSANSLVRLEGEEIDVVKFFIRDLYTDNPSVYFLNTARHNWHNRFLEKMNIPWENGHEGAIAWDPNVVAPDGTLGVYRYYFWASSVLSFEHIENVHAILGAAMPVVGEHNNLAYYQIRRVPQIIAQYEAEKAKYDASRINVLLFEDLMPDVDYIAFNQAEGFGLLRLMGSGGGDPRPHEIPIYESLPNDLPRVAGTITNVPQTPLSHVNLRAIQNRVPNAFIRDILKDETLKALIGKHVFFSVAADGFVLREATKAEVDEHHESRRPASAQTPERDLTVTKIAALADISFGDWDAFGVKAANMAELSKLGLPAGTVPAGFAVPFYFYDEFMKANGLYGDVAEMLADEDFRGDYDEQKKQLKALRKKIKKGTTPEWMIDALEAMHAKYPEGTSLRYRSSTNNEDLPAFNGAGLYDSKTQDPDETADDGIDKSIKAVWASLWNFRAFLERDYYRVDHLQTAMGVLVHPNFSDELVNGVAVSYDPVTFSSDAFYVNSQLGEDLVTNPEANSYPEELLLDSQGKATVLARSNLAEPGQLLMSEAQMAQLRDNLKAIHDRFKTLYNTQDGEDFAIEIEFKITADNTLAIKQARPWIFAAPISGGDNGSVGPSLLTPSAHTVSEKQIHVVVLEYSQPRGKISFTFAGPDTHHFKLYGFADLLVFEAQDYHAPADANGDGVYEFELTVTDSGAGTTKVPMRFTVTEAVPIPPEISVTAGDGITEGANAVFTVSASPAPPQPLTVNVAVAQIGDFGVSTGPQTVTVGTVGTATLTVATSDDDADESDGSVTVSVKAGDGYTVSSSQGTATAEVAEDDEVSDDDVAEDDDPPPAVPEISVTAGSGVTEGADASFTVSASPVPTAPLAVSVSVAQSGDFEASTGSRTVTVPTSGSVTVTVSTSDDGADEPDGSVTVTVNSGDGYTVSTTQSSATVNVADDDDPPPATPVVSVTGGSGVTEGANAQFTVSASPAPSAPLQVSVTVAQQGDYGAATGSRAVTVSTSGTATLTVSTSDDDADEADGSVTVTVNSGDGYTVSTTQSSATVNVADDDDPPPAVPEISVTAGSGVTEGADASFTVSASPVPTAPLAVSVSVAQSGDFEASTGSRTVTVPTSGSVTVTVSTSDDGADEPDGSVTVTVNSGDGYTVSTTQSSATVNVADDDDPPPADLPVVSVSDASVVEGEFAGFSLLEFRISLDKPSHHNITVHYRVHLGTTLPSDHHGGSSRAKIWAGHTHGSIVIMVIDDTQREGEETLEIELTGADGAAIDDNNTATGTIIDND